MPRSHRPYALKFRQQMVELIRAGRTPTELAQEFEPTAESIRNWVKQAEIDAGHRTDGLTSDEKQELARLRRENKLELPRFSGQVSTWRNHIGIIETFKLNRRGIPQGRVQAMRIVLAWRDGSVFQDRFGSW